ncbi:MAG TPA: hypothetical protein VJB15_03080 [Rhodothermia bacterium]|nr:hypothetical protein [Rhodothermia bacterium]
MRCNVHASSSLNPIRTLLAAGVALALASLPACSTIASVADQPRAMRQISPARLSRSYETPIPHNGQRVASLSRVDPRGYEKLVSTVGTIFEVGAAFTPLGARPGTASSLEVALDAARWVCDHGLTLEMGKKWWEKVALQPAALALGISQERCYGRYRRIH